MESRLIEMRRDIELNDADEMEEEQTPIQEDQAICVICLAMAIVDSFLVYRGSMELWNGLLLIAMNTFMSSDFFPAGKKIRRIVERIVGVSHMKRLKSVVSSIVVSTIVFLVGSICVFWFTYWIQVDHPRDLMKFLMLMGFGSLTYSRSIRIIMGKRPTIGRMITTGVFMVLMGVFIFMCSPRSSYVCNNIRSEDIGRMRWNNSLSKYEIIYYTTRGDPEAPRFEEVKNNVLNPILDTMGDTWFCNSIRAVDIPKGQVICDFFHNDILISKYEDRGRRELFRKILESGALMRGEYFVKYNILKAVLLPIGSLVIVIVSRALSKNRWKEGERRHMGFLGYVFIYLLAVILVCQICVMFYIILMDMRMRRYTEVFVKRYIDSIISRLSVLQSNRLGETINRPSVVQSNEPPSYEVASLPSYSEAVSATSSSSVSPYPSPPYSPYLPHQHTRSGS